MFGTFEFIKKHFSREFRPTRNAPVTSASPNTSNKYLVSPVIFLVLVTHQQQMLAPSLHRDHEHERRNLSHFFFSLPFPFFFLSEKTVNAFLMKSALRWRGAYKLRGAFNWP